MPKKVQTVTLKEARQTIKSKEGLYEAMQRNRWYLPKLTSTIVTISWMMKVKNGEVYCPKYSDIHLLPCPKKPLKSHIIEEVKRILNANNWDMDINQTHEPDIDWCMDFISSKEPDHRYFKKDYLPSFEESRKYNPNVQIPDQEEIKISNEDDFFTDLPPEQGFSKSRKSIFPVPQDLQQIQKLNNFQKTRARLLEMKKQLEGFNEIQDGFNFDSDDENPQPYEKLMRQFEKWNLRQKQNKQCNTEIKQANSQNLSGYDSDVKIKNENQINLAQTKSGFKIPIFQIPKDDQNQFQPIFNS